MLHPLAERMIEFERVRLEKSGLRLKVDEKPVRVLKFTTQGPDWGSEFQHCLGQLCNGWEQKIDLHSLRETTPWWWRVLRWVSLRLLPDLREWEARYTPTYSRWE